MPSDNQNTGATPLLPHSTACTLKTVGHLTPLCRWNKKKLEELIKTRELIKKSMKEAEEEEARLQEENTLLAIEYHTTSKEIIECQQKIYENVAIAQARAEAEKNGSVREVATSSNPQNALHLNKPNVGGGSVSSPKS